MPFTEYPPLPSHPGLDLAAFTEPFKGEKVNGDGLFVETGRADGRLMALLVDVTHHGPSTIATMNTIRRALGNAAARDRSPSGLLRELHGNLWPEWDTTTKFACALAILLEAAEVVGANAASPSPFLRTGGPWRRWDWPGSPPLGVPDPDQAFTDITAPFPLGSALLAFTDGVTEAGAKVGVGQFQHAGLAAHLAGQPAGVPPPAVIADLAAALKAHVGALWPDDDTTAYCLGRV